MERAASISDVMRMRMAGDVAGLCRAAWSENHGAAVYATAMLGSAVRTPEVVRTLHLCLTRGDEPLPGLHWHALASLGRLRVERAVPLLLRTLAESDHNRRQLDKVACEALLAIGGPEVVRGLVGLCERLPSGRGYWTVRVLDALAALRASEAVTPLLATLWGYLPDLAVRVVRTLGAIGDSRAASALLVLAHSPASDTHLRRAAVEALHALPAVGWPPPHRHPAVERLLHTPQRDPDPDTARLATALLARTEDGRAHLWDVLRGAAEQGGPDCPPTPWRRSVRTSRRSPASSPYRTTGNTTPCSRTFCARRRHRPCAGPPPGRSPRPQGPGRPMRWWRRWTTCTSATRWRTSWPRCRSRCCPSWWTSSRAPVDPSPAGGA
ncbi:hypothetical protein [Streptomyces sp. NPDC126514]|uniref:HEAT repeat domain-containing protein n=1 Tax=Streptomyces sp. NPDC126514 TaxID=3155210 RepID=UPI0033185185